MSNKKEECKKLHTEEELGKEVDTDEDVVFYPKAHLKKIYEEAVIRSKFHKDSISLSLKRIKAITLLEDRPSYSHIGRKYFDDVRVIVQIVTASRAELAYFNAHESDEKFQGYCYSVELKKLLRVYDGKCYKTVGSNDPRARHFTDNIEEESREKKEV